jgi:hypothetical protein
MNVTKVKTLGLKMRITIVFAAIAFIGKISSMHSIHQMKGTNK